MLTKLGIMVRTHGALHRDGAELLLGGSVNAGRAAIVTLSKVGGSGFCRLLLPVNARADRTVADRE